MGGACLCVWCIRWFVWQSDTYAYVCTAPLACLHVSLGLCLEYTHVESVTHMQEHVCVWDVCGVWGYVCVPAPAYLCMGRICVSLGGYTCVSLACLWRILVSACAAWLGCPRASLMVTHNLPSLFALRPLRGPGRSLLGDVSRSLGRVLPVLRSEPCAGCLPALRLPTQPEHCSQSGPSCADLDGGSRLGVYPQQASRALATLPWPSVGLIAHGVGGGHVSSQMTGQENWDLGRMFLWCRCAASVPVPIPASLAWAFEGWQL